MLPVHRIIGHREYGNRAPGGWPGRKTDPQYDMEWRRRRVAAFTPRGDDMPTASEIVDELLNRRVARQGPGSEKFPTPHTTLGQTVAWLDSNLGAIRAENALLQGQVAGLAAALERIAGATDGVDADELKAHISGEVDRVVQRIAEGYDLSLRPKPDSSPA